MGDFEDSQSDGGNVVRDWLETFSPVLATPAHGRKPRKDAGLRVSPPLSGITTDTQKGQRRWWWRTHLSVISQGDGSCRAQLAKIARSPAEHPPASAAQGAHEVPCFSRHDRMNDSFLLFSINLLTGLVQTWPGFRCRWACRAPQTQEMVVDMNLHHLYYYCQSSCSPEY